MITLTTVGYGDLVPATIAGQLVACVCAVAGLLVLTLPLSIIGEEFKAVLVEQNQIKFNAKLMMSRSNKEHDDYEITT